MELKPCPFCGNDEPRLARRLDESLWSHETVEWVHITCDECDCESASSEVHDDVIAAWNQRASIPPNTPAPSDDEIRKVWNRTQDPIATVRAFVPAGVAGTQGDKA